MTLRVISSGTKTLSLRIKLSQEKTRLELKGVIDIVYCLNSFNLFFPPPAGLFNLDAKISQFFKKKLVYVWIDLYEKIFEKFFLKPHAF